MICDFDARDVLGCGAKFIAAQGRRLASRPRFSVLDEQLVAQPGSFGWVGLDGTFGAFGRHDVNVTIRAWPTAIVTARAWYMGLSDRRDHATGGG